MQHGRTSSGWRLALDRFGLRRRMVVAALTGIAVVSGLSAARPAPPPTVAVWVAAHDLPGGEPLAGSDVRAERLPVPDVPSGVLRAASPITGRLLAAPMRRGEPLTDVRLLSSALVGATGAAADVAVPVRVADGAAALALVRPGELIDVIATPDADSAAAAPTTAVVHGVRVLADPPRDVASDGDSDPGGLLIVEASPHQAAALAQAATGAQLSVAVHQPP